MSISPTATPKPLKGYDDYPVYPDENLWTSYTPAGTAFKLWSPVATEVAVNFYAEGDGGSLLDRFMMAEKKAGLWQLYLTKDLQGLYYTYQTKVNGVWLEETPGIYATAVGVNGKRAMVLDLASTNPDGWETDSGPALASPNDAVLYEVHVRDLTICKNAGNRTPGKYLGLVEAGTRNAEGLATGLDHMKELGITHVHLLPVFDFCSIDESALERQQYNWGYDPLNYNVPEGSYSSDPYHAPVRIREFKAMVQGLHQSGLGVIMDVVYNHTGTTDDSNFNLEVPGYYYRHTGSGGWSDASGCGNETASERTMMRKFIIESCLFWVQEYHIDGFRFDLMGIHDLETMNQLSDTLRRVRPDILLYGEGWTAGASPLPEEERAIKANTYKMRQIAAFSDMLRDGLKGSVFDARDKGFVSGARGMEERIKYGVVGSIRHPGVHADKSPWAGAPWQAVSYVACHDNQTLYDKLKASTEKEPETDIISMHLLANAVVLTSQGIPFLMAGEEMLRTKRGEHNSYNLPDYINQIDWAWKTAHPDVFGYYTALIALRKAHPAFRMPTTSMVAEHLRFVPSAPGFVGYYIEGHANSDSWKNIAIFYNANKTQVRVELEGTWQVAVAGRSVHAEGMQQVHGPVLMQGLSMLLLFQED
ncbi:type I pullulanase [Pontibacter sp. E15-1]|uniref:type I pullulanase n=1 Tax=Pontibacter sp. E15-1 TaxID=2919918 RepID=UPI001F4FB350|nr:type I pullulanase [Pontibacter sp. E15-1]MCJ8165077.1 type I pullulanase [Pontibacter sp. E15-1]